MCYCNQSTENWFKLPTWKGTYDSVENITYEVMNSFYTVLCLYLKRCKRVLTQIDANNVVISSVYFPSSD
jgi:hypothetical protein